MNEPTMETAAREWERTAMLWKAEAEDYKERYENIMAADGVDVEAWIADQEALAIEQNKNAIMKNALQMIANEDYRGNRPTSAFIAEKALQAVIKLDKVSKE